MNRPPFNKESKIADEDSISNFSGCSNISTSSSGTDNSDMISKKERGPSLMFNTTEAPNLIRGHFQRSSGYASTVSSGPPTPGEEKPPFRLLNPQTPDCPQAPKQENMHEIKQNDLSTKKKIPPAIPPKPKLSFLVNKIVFLSKPRIILPREEASNQQNMLRKEDRKPVFAPFQGPTNSTQLNDGLQLQQATVKGNEAAGSKESNPFFEVLDGPDFFSRPDGQAGGDGSVSKILEHQRWGDSVYRFGV